MGDGMDGFMYFTFAEVVFQRCLLGFRRADRHIHQFVDAFIFSRGNGDYRHAQFFRELRHVNGVPAGADLVHHVQGNDHGDPQLYQLQGKIEVPLDVGGVYDIDDAVGVFF